MRYQIREGIVLETVCGESMLIATFAARKACPYILELNDASVLIWKGLTEGLNESEIAKRASDEFEVSYEEAREAIRDFLLFLEQNGYLIRQDESEAQNIQEGITG